MTVRQALILARASRHAALKINNQLCIPNKAVLYSNRLMQKQCSTKSFSSWSERGYDLNQDLLSSSDGSMPKIIVDGYASSGFDIINLVKNVDKEATKNISGVIHLNGSIIAFSHGCFLWNISGNVLNKNNDPSEITLESLSPIFLHRPKVEYIFIGYDNVRGQSGMSAIEFSRIREAATKEGIIVERLSISSAIGTFNLLNAEDRQIALALVVPKEEDV